MAYVTNYKYDVFVSYAHVDNVPLQGAKHGWVTTLVNNLETLLAKKLGRRDASFWMDHQLAGNAPLTPAIMDALRETATLIVIVSPGYLASEWCRREREAFLELIRERTNAGSRFFLVECDKVEESEIPSELSDLIGYRFWVQDRESKSPRTLGTPEPHPTEQEYYARLLDLSHDLAAELKRLKMVSEEAVPTAVADVSGHAVKPTVFLAEVTDDLDSQREDVKRYLTQAGLRVLPETWYPRDDLAAFQQLVDRDLTKCRLFVQLLSGIVGKKPPGWKQGYAGFQFERASQARTPIIQWRSRELDLATVADSNHLSLLERDTVRAGSLEEFKQAVVEEALREPLSSVSESSLDAFIFVNTDLSDRHLAESIGEMLLKYDIGYAMPLTGGKPTEIREDLEENLRNCDALIIIYGKTAATWVRNQLLQYRKIISKREQPLRALAIYEGPPPDKAELAFMLPNMRSLNCRDGLNERALREFIEGLRRQN